MKAFFQTNRLFFVLFGCFILVGGVLVLYIEKGDAVLFFSENRHPFWNVFFKYGTKIGEEPAYIVGMLLLLLVRIRHIVWLPLLGGVVTLVSYLLKSYFQIPRPKSYFESLCMLEQVNFVPSVEVHAAATSFPSGHTMSAFALFGLLAFLFPPKKILAICCFLLALIVGISRVYLAQHFWQDVYVGGILGVVLAIVFWWLQAQWKLDDHKWWHRSILDQKKTPVA